VKLVLEVHHLALIGTNDADTTCELLQSSCLSTVICHELHKLFGKVCLIEVALRLIVTDLSGVSDVEEEKSILHY